MSTIPHEHVHSVFTSMCIASTLKIIAPYNNKRSTTQIHKVSKGVSKIILKFPHEVIFRTRNSGTLLLAFLFFVMVFWKSLSTWSLAANLDDLEVSIPFLLSQVEAVNVETSSSNQRFSKSQCGEVIHRIFVSIRIHNLRILRSEQGSTPRIDRSFC
jgi:hypothetical protein